ncbi:MAG: class I SAM-dependent methyltransferase [Elusimicrobia bacterium CG08_land_8_20_14_0_20_59_10]|nr:MAG: class I SAM-dependent methyltransferase [Elusimicrobia bacterium CG08_land_8_20_14_0_20_59_10]
MKNTSNDSLEMPKAEEGGLTNTLNSMGTMTPSPDTFSRAFIEFAPKAPGRSLDIGAAYGVATLPALSSGASVIANDIDERHLKILFNRVPQTNRSRLELVAGEFPDKLDFPAGSLGAVLICRVMHFFDGPRIERAATKVMNWLAPGGKVFVVGETPFIGTARAFFPTYEARLKAGNPWPGVVENVAAHDPKRSGSLPALFHLLDERILGRVFTAAGFGIERLELFARPDYPADIRLDGRESVGLIAIKK